ncbi:putative benzoate 4-monooxygenase cytochrome P450 [Paraphaeosphaeria sporulosa]|uniref:Putative benzoate 4-monooxygenase cytochrome P450 n=1 Tax=Paraphaeosphaeria sporulosa TaxID=1460663 RepID=A0A177CVG5_9PLEO|nr:putative benzoate 4-monooxygenase cytochrome P450 [Paraphaeosphaeria sporulosa]OAG11211.1 putative benzoate 4-monooxygenase cytochrome P450 [Paraphaeosphaeria sporulosa]
MKPKTLLSEPGTVKEAVVWAVALILVLLALQSGRTWWRLRHIPGPFLASLTDLYRINWVWSKQAHLKLQQCHKRYGKVVRIGPNTVSFSDPAAVPTVYPMRAGIPKSNFYVTLRPYTSGQALHAVFNTTEEDLLKQIKPPIAPLFSVSSAATLEPLVDTVLECIHTRFDERFADKEQVFDMGQWLQFFAFDVMGSITFSKRYGFLDEGRDVGGMLGTIVDFMRAAAPMTQSYLLDKFLRKNIIADTIRRHIGATPSLTILAFVARAIKEKREALESGNESKAEAMHTDYLTRYLALQRSKPSIPQWAPTAWTFSNVIAGSDSVGTTMRTLLFNLLSYPHTLSKLQSELSAAGLSRPYPRYAEVRDLPYLDACVQEAIRVHPPFALPLERVVPPEGLSVLGTWLPGGSVVGGSPYVVNRDVGLYGEDAEFWRPERWLGVDAALRRDMENSMLTFGAGRRICLGRHVAFLEIKKLIPFLVLTYNIRLVDREKFETENSWFFFQRNFNTQIRKAGGIETL